MGIQGPRQQSDGYLRKVLPQQMQSMGVPPPESSTQAAPPLALPGEGQASQAGEQDLGVKQLPGSSRESHTGRLELAGASTEVNQGSFKQASPCSSEVGRIC